MSYGTGKKCHISTPLLSATTLWFAVVDCVAFDSTC